MPRPKRTLAEADKNAERAPAAKKASSGRTRAKGKENELPVTKKASNAKDKRDNFFAPRAKKALDDKANEKEADANANEDVTTNEAAGEANTPDASAVKKVPANEPNVDEKVVEAAKDVTSGKGKATESDVPSTSNNANEASTTKKATAPSTTATATHDRERRLPLDVDGKTWICICRPVADVAKELDVYEDDDDYPKSTCGGGTSCICHMAADEFPHHKWIMTKKGFDLMREWREQQEKRCQDNFDMYIFNDFDGYGTAEVIENMFVAFTREHKKKTQNVMEMWSIVESMAGFFMNGDMMSNHMLDDSEGNAKRIMLTGTALLTTIDLLIKKGWFTNNSSEIRNIGLVLSQFLRFVEDEKDCCQRNEDGWKAVVVNKADTHGVIIQGLAGTEKLVEAIRAVPFDNSSDPVNTKGWEHEFENMMMSYKNRELWGVMTVEKLNSGEKRIWREYNWVLELGAYQSFQAVKVWANGPTSGGKIGGKFYDLTAQRNKGRHMKEYKLGTGRHGF